MARRLPTVKGYTVDQRLSQFRKVTWHEDENPSIEFVEFMSPKGEQLLEEMEETGEGELPF